MSKSVGRYEIREELGRGGMATVYLAIDPRLDRRVALKLMDHQLTGDPSFAARFEREAKTVASLEHGAIVPLHDYGEADGWLYLVMRYMRGGSLKEKISRGALTPDASYDVVQRIGSALDKAHRMGVIHRDLKPGNILLDEEGESYLSDFGIVKVAKGEEEFLTETGQTLGTFAYMSPEQVLGKELDGRSDIYALGVVLYEMLTGVHPYEKVATTSGAMAVAHTRQPIPDVTRDNPDLPPALRTVIQRALAKHPNDRYETCSVMTAAMAAAMQAALTSRDAATGAATAGAATTREDQAATRSVPQQPATHQPVRQPATQRPAQPPPAAPAKHQPAPAGTAQDAKRKLPAWAFVIAGVAVIALIIFAFMLVGNGKEPQRVTGHDDNDGGVAVEEKASTNEEQPGGDSDPLAPNGEEEGEEDSSGGAADTEAAEALFIEAEAELYTNERPARALALIERAIELDPEVGRFYDLRAHARAGGSGDFDAAIIDMNKAIELEPLAGYLYASRGNLKVSNDDLSGAIADFDKAIDLEPDSPYHYTGLADIYLQIGAMDDARAVFERAIEVDPQNHFPYTELASRMGPGRIGDTEDAIRVLEVCIEKVTSEAHWCMYDRGWRLDELGLTEAAAASFQDFLNTVPSGACPGCQDEARAYIDSNG